MLIGGETQSHVGGLQHMGDIRRKSGDLKSQGHHVMHVKTFITSIKFFRIVA